MDQAGSLEGVSPPPSGDIFQGNYSSGNARTHNGHIFGGVVHNYHEDSAARQEQIYHDCLRWLNAPDPATDHYEARRRHEPGTGQWLLDSDEYKKWKSGDIPLLWLHGPAGCCKTILCSAVIKDVQQSCSSQDRLIYFYFTFRDPAKQDYEGFLLSAILQLLRSDNVPTELLVAKARNQRHHESLEPIARGLISQYPKVFVVVDGLDESPDGRRKTILDGLISLIRGCASLKLLMASRRESDIEESMNGLDVPIFAIQAESVNEDIMIYVKNELERHNILRRLSADVKKLVCKDLGDKAGGMFRWVDCQLDELKKLKVLREQHVKKVLDDLPRTLDETYDRILLQFKDTDEVKTILRFVAYGKEKLTPSELEEACITDCAQSPSVDERSRGTIAWLIRDLSLLLRLETYDHDSERGQRVVSLAERSVHDSKRSQTVVSFAHRSVREYLTSQYIREGPAAEFHLPEAESHYAIAQTCMAYLVFLKHKWERLPDIDQAERQDVRPDCDYCRKTMARRIGTDFAGCERNFAVALLASRYLLTTYAASHWHEHLREAEQRTPANGPSDMFHRLLQDKNSPSFFRYLYYGVPELLPICWPVAMARSASFDGFALVLAAGLGLQHSSANLAESYTRHLAESSDLGLAFIAVAYFEDDAISSAITKDLLNRGVGKRRSNDWTRQQYERLTKEYMDIQHRAIRSYDVGQRLNALCSQHQILDPAQNCLVNAFCTTLLYTNFRAAGVFRQITLLVEAGMDLNMPMPKFMGLTALQHFCTKVSDGRWPRVRALLRAGADPNLPEHGIRPLWYAVTNDDRHFGLAIDLLQYHADPNSGRDDGENTETALQTAYRLPRSGDAGELHKAGAKEDFRITPYGPKIETHPPKRENHWWEDKYTDDENSDDEGSDDESDSPSHSSSPQKLRNVGDDAPVSCLWRSRWNGTFLPNFQVTGPNLPSMPGPGSTETRTEDVLSAEDVD